MGLKSLEMQVALPRSQDAGKVQDQVNRQGEQLQHTLTHAQLEQEKKKRTQIQKQKNKGASARSATYKLEHFAMRQRKHSERM